MPVTIDEIIEEKIAERLSQVRLPVQEPELIKLDAAREICKTSNDVIQFLFKDRLNNGFPGVRLGAKTFRVDRHRLYSWIRRGGLDGFDSQNS